MASDSVLTSSNAQLYPSLMFRLIDGDCRASSFATKGYRAERAVPRPPLTFLLPASSLSAPGLLVLVPRLLIHVGALSCIVDYELDHPAGTINFLSYRFLEHPQA